MTFTSAYYAQLVLLQTEIEGFGTEGFILAGQMNVEQIVGATGFLFCRPEFEKQLIALHVLHLQFPQTLDEFLQAPLAHWAFLIRAPLAASKNVQIFLM